MPYPNEHAARLRSPDDFDPDSFRRTAGGRIFNRVDVPSSVGIIWGKLKGSSKPSDPPIVQALRFPTKNWTASAAKGWLRTNKIKYILFEPAAGDKHSADGTDDADAADGKDNVMEQIRFAEGWTTAYINDLPDSSFLYIEPGGKKDADGKTVPRTLRHFPYRDKAGKLDLRHLRNALSQIPKSKLPQSVKDACAAKARRILDRAQKEQHAALPASAFLFACSPDAVQFAEAGKPESGFVITAYDGGVTRHPYWGNFAIDLEGLSFAAKRLPVLESHDPVQRLGFTTKNKIDGAVTFEGKFLQNESAKETRQDMLDGFPMQASLNVPAGKIEQIAEGASAQVNGRTVRGPGAIFRQAVVREVSMCVFGALNNTRSEAFAGAEIDPTEILFSTKENIMSKEEFLDLTPDVLRTEYPEVFAAVRNAASAEAIQAEKERFEAIRKACGDDAALAGECFAAGLTVADALGKRNAKLSADLAAANEKLNKTAVQSPIDKATAEFKAQPAPADKDKAAFDEAKATDTELEAHFAATQDLRDRFSSAKAYVAHIRHPAQASRRP
jgi:hypothetical protein